MPKAKTLVAALTKAKPEYRVIGLRWTKSGGFNTTRLETVAKLPRNLGINQKNNTALIGLKINPRGPIEITGVNTILAKRPGGLAADGRCTL